MTPDSPIPKSNLVAQQATDLVGCFKALLRLLHVAQWLWGVKVHHALHNEGGAAVHLRVLGHHHVDVARDPRDVGCRSQTEEEQMTISAMGPCIVA